MPGSRSLPLLLLLVACVVGVALLYVADSDGPVAPSSLPSDGVPEAGAVGRTALLHGAGHEVREGATPANPYAGVTDWQKLGRGLWLNAERPAAVARAAELLRGDAAGIRTLIRRLHPRFDTRQDAGQSIFRGVAQTLVRLGDEALDVAVEELDDENAVYRTRVVALVGSFGEKAARVLPALLRHYRAIEEDPPAGETASYVNALAALGPTAREIVPDLEAWVDDGATREVELASIHALARLLGPTERLFAHYLDVLHAGGWEAQRQAVLQELGTFGAKAAPMIPSLLELVDGGELGLEAAMRTFAFIGVPDPEVLARAEKGLAALPPDWEHLGACGFALARLGPAGLRPLLAYVETHGLAARAKLMATLWQAGFEHERIFRMTHAALDAPEVATRRAAWHGLWLLMKLSSATLTPALLRALQDKDREVVRTAVGIAGRHALSPALRAALIGRVEDPGVARDDRIEAAMVLVRAPGRPPERLFNALIALAEDGTSGDAALYLAPWLASHTAVVLRLWARGLSRELPRVAVYVRRAYAGPIAALPVATRRRHAEAMRALGIDPETGKPAGEPPR